jgi:hypothetical protein
MATSGTVVFRQNRDAISTLALTIVGAVDAENPNATAAQLSNSALLLNLMVKSLQTIGLELWERKYAAVFPQVSQGIYALGLPGPGGDHATFANNLNVGNFVQTTLTATAAGGATQVTLASLIDAGTVGIPTLTVATGFFIGVQLDTGSLFWTTVNGAPVGSTVTLANALPSQASSGNLVYSYQTKLMRPLRVLDGFYRQLAGNDVPIRIISRDEYNRFGLKTSTGTPIQAFYDPQTNQGLLEMYPQPADVRGVIFVEVQKPIEDFNSATDDYDLPQEWGEYLVWGLARRLMSIYKVPVATASEIRMMAKETLEQVKGWDQENTSMFLQPEDWMYMNLRR